MQAAATDVGGEAEGEESAESSHIHHCHGGRFYVHTERLDAVKSFPG